MIKWKINSCLVGIFLLVPQFVKAEGITFDKTWHGHGVFAALLVAADLNDVHIGALESIDDIDVFSSTCSFAVTVEDQLPWDEDPGAVVGDSERIACDVGLRLNPQRTTVSTGLQGISLEPVSLDYTLEISSPSVSNRLFAAAERLMLSRVHGGYIGETVRELADGHKERTLRINVCSQVYSDVIFYCTQRRGEQGLDTNCYLPMRYNPRLDFCPE